MFNQSASKEEREKSYKEGENFRQRIPEPSVAEIIEVLLKNNCFFLYGFTGEYLEFKNLKNNYVLRNKDEFKNEIEKVFKTKKLNFEQIILLIELYEIYKLYDEKSGVRYAYNIGESEVIKKYINTLSKMDTPNKRLLEWIDFFENDLGCDIRGILDYDFERIKILLEGV